MHPVLAFFLLALFFAIGDFISIKTKALVPSLLIFVILLLACAWSGIVPKDIITTGGFSGPLIGIIMVVIVVNMGCSLSFADLKNEWKTVVIGLAAVCGVAVFVLPIGAAIFGWNIAAAAAPPIAGGLVAAFEMSRAAIAKNMQSASTLALLILSLQSIPAYFIVPLLLKRACKQNLAIRRDTVRTSGVSTEKKRLIPAVPEKYQSTATFLAFLSVVGVLAVYSSMASKQVFASFGITYDISATIFALFYGVIFGELGFLEPKSLQKANVFGFFCIGSFVGVMGGLVNSTPSEIVELLLPIATLIALGIVGIILFSVIAGRFCKMSWEMSAAIGLNCLLGFPTNFLLTTEAINASASSEDEKDYLTGRMMPSMLVGGFVTVTIGSVIFAGILKNFI